MNCNGVIWTPKQQKCKSDEWRHNQSFLSRSPNTIRWISSTDPTWNGKTWITMNHNDPGRKIDTCGLYGLELFETRSWIFTICFVWCYPRNRALHFFSRPAALPDITRKETVSGLYVSNSHLPSQGWRLQSMGSMDATEVELSRVFRLEPNLNRRDITILEVNPEEEVYAKTQLTNSFIKTDNSH